MTLRAKRDEIRQAVGLLVIGDTERTKRSDMVNVQFSIERRFMNLTALTGVLVALACFGALDFPVWPIVRLVTALPVIAVLASGVHRCPFSLTDSRAKLSFWNLVRVNHYGLAAPDTGHSDFAALPVRRLLSTLGKRLPNTIAFLRASLSLFGVRRFDREVVIADGASLGYALRATGIGAISSIALSYIGRVTLECLSASLTTELHCYYLNKKTLAGHAIRLLSRQPGDQQGPKSIIAAPLRERKPLGFLIA